MRKTNNMLFGKVFLFAISFCLVLGLASIAMATSVTVTDATPEVAQDGTVTISGTIVDPVAGQQVTIKVLDADATPDIAYINQAASTDGTFSFTFKSKADAATGLAKVWVGGTGITVDPLTPIATYTIGGANHAPIVAIEPPVDSAVAVEKTTTFDLVGMFTDEDTTDTLTLSVTSDDEGIATASIEGNTLSVTGVGFGTTNINVTANDGHGGTVTATFAINVFIFGDVDGDGTIASSDIDNLMLYLGEEITLSPVAMLAADVDGDFTLASADVDNIGLYLGEEISRFPAQDQ